MPGALSAAWLPLLLARAAPGLSLRLAAPELFFSETRLLVDGRAVPFFSEARLLVDGRAEGASAGDSGTDTLGGRGGARDALAGADGAAALPLAMIVS
mmetsp:Transcript_31978/g.94203  ORF Transcript_31978/g.94203 Transcript_31978/m.94203 type:complete len:98 (+) Transcript_31978:444-737(+)